VENWLRGEGWNDIWLTTDTDEGFRAVGFYRHQGWEDWKIEEGNRYMRKRFEPGSEANAIQPVHPEVNPVSSTVGAVVDLNRSSRP
jgi:hypothetical protein